jgi:tetratricopeptide (TPR) repeat protein
MSEPQEIEKTAMEFVSAAVEFEKQGETEKAITLYQKAIGNLTRLVKRYPNYGFKEIYSDRSASYQERIKTLQAASTKAETKEPLPEIEESPQKAAQSESSVDLAAILQEINQKIDALTGSIAELKDEVASLKLNVNDVVGKTEQAQKEVVEIRNLVYAIKYDR